MVVLNVALKLVMERLKVLEMLLIDSGRIWVFSGFHGKFIANYKNLLYLFEENLIYKAKIIITTQIIFALKF